MKSTKEILRMLVDELINHFDKIKPSNNRTVYFNEMLGDTSFLLAGLLESILKKNISDWDKRKWMDDSLLTDFKMKDNKVHIGGVMIWGMVNTTEQWVTPFLFEMELHKNGASFKRFSFYFCDLSHPAVTYEEFRHNRDFGRRSARNWKYVINSDEILIS